MKKIFEDLFFFFGEHLRLCPWSLASSIPVLGLERVCPRKGCPWPWPRIFFCVLGLEPCVFDSTSAKIMFDYIAFICKQNSLRFCLVRYRYSFVNEIL